MSEPNPFEDRLASALRDLATEAPTHVDAVAFAHAIAHDHPRSRWIAPAFASRRPVLMRAIIAAVLLLAALLAISGVGSWLRDRDLADDPTPTVVPLLSFQDDFATAIADRWSFHGGAWEVVEGQLQGLGEVDHLHVDSPSALDLAGAVATANGVVATDVSICADMTSLDRVDKGFVLRWIGPNDGIWLGFRGLESFIIEGLASDLTVAEAVDGKPMLFTPSHTIPILSHDLGDTIHVCAVLVGQRLTVDVDGQRVLDREFPVQVRAGAAGVHALAANLAAYDNVRINAVAVP